jgi:hypothetical protein
MRRAPERVAKEQRRLRPDGWAIVSAATSRCWGVGRWPPRDRGARPGDRREVEGDGPHAAAILGEAVEQSDSRQGLHILIQSTARPA